MFFQSSVKGSSDSEYLLSPTVRNERKQCEVGDVMENKLWSMAIPLSEPWRETWNLQELQYWLEKIIIYYSYFSVVFYLLLRIQVHKTNTSLLEAAKHSYLCDLITLMEIITVVNEVLWLMPIKLFVCKLMSRAPRIKK